jgi:hypothetical protein
MVGRAALNLLNRLGIVSLSIACSDPVSGPNESARPSAAVGVRATTPDLVGTGSTTADRPNAQTWSFEEGEGGRIPPGLEVFTVAGEPSAWSVSGHQFAHSPGRVLYVADAHDQDARFTGLLSEPRRNVRTSVYCTLEARRHNTVKLLPNPTGVCGVVTRFKDARNHVVALANAYDQTVTLTLVSNGQRKQLGSSNIDPVSSLWHQLELEVNGDELVVSWDGRRMVSAKDATILEQGRVGIWTHVNSLSNFDDFSVQSL